MRSVTSCFNKTIFLNNIKRFWPLWTIYNIIWVISLPISLPGIMARNMGIRTTGRYILQMAGIEGSIMGFAFGVLSALTVFSYLYTARSAGAFHTLPIRREGMFLSSFLSGLTWLLVSNVFIFVLSVLSELLFGSLQIGYLLQWLGIVSLQCVFFFGFGTFCAMLTGQGFALVVIYAVLNFAVVIIEAIVRYCLSLFCYGFTSMGSLNFGSLSPVYWTLLKSRVIQKTISEGVYSYSFTGWTTLIIYCAVGLLFAAAALLIYKRRKSESASEFIAIDALRPVFKYFFAFIGSLVLGLLFYSIIFEISNYESTGSAIPMLCCMIFGGFLGYYITAMLLNKSFRVFKKTTPGFIVYTLALIAFVMAFELDLFGIERNTPDPGSVASLRVSSNGNNLNYDEEAVIKQISAAQKSIIANKGVHESYLRQHKSQINAPDSGYPNVISLYFNYSLKNGKTVNRRYTLYDDFENDLRNVTEVETSLNSQAAISDSMSEVLAVSPDSVSTIELHYMDKNGNSKSEILVKNSAKDFLANCVQADIRSGKLGKVSLTDVDKRKYEFAVLIRIEGLAAADDPKGYGEAGLNVFPGKDAEKTLAYLKSIGIEPSFDMEEISGVTKYMKD